VEGPLLSTHRQAGLGLTGAGRSYLLSPKFLQSHGGLDAVVWVSPDIAELLADRLPPTVEVGPDAAVS